MDKPFNIHDWQVKYLINEVRIGDNSFKTRSLIKGKDTEITIDNTSNLDDITIRWRGTNHWGNKTFQNLEFIYDPDVRGDDHGQVKDAQFFAKSEDKTWVFMVDVSIDGNYEESGTIHDVMWNTLEIKHIDDSKIEPEPYKTLGLDDPRTDPAIRSDFDDPVFQENSLGGAGSGASFSPGNSMSYIDKKSFKKKNR